MMSLLSLLRLNTLSTQTMSILMFSLNSNWIMGSCETKMYVYAFLELHNNVLIRLAKFFLIEIVICRTFKCSLNTLIAQCFLGLGQNVFLELHNNVLIM